MQSFLIKSSYETWILCQPIRYCFPFFINFFILNSSYLRFFASKKNQTSSVEFFPSFAVRFFVTKLSQVPVQVLKFCKSNGKRT